MNYSIVSPKKKEEFNQYYYFRWEYLRKALGKQLGTERDNIEDLSIHRMVLNEKKQIIAVGRVHHNTAIESQVRYFAVDKNYRRQGIGSYLMQDLESIALRENRQIMMLNARENALSFYGILGYEISKKTNLLFGKIQHYEMKKVL